MIATAPFSVSGWDPAAADQPDAGPALSRVAIQKAFAGGDFEGTGEGEGLFCGMDDPTAGAGYVVSERLTGTLHGRTGSFVIQHGGLMGPDVPPHTFGNVVPGSGTGELSGLSGTVQIAQADGVHTMTLTYALPGAS